MNRFKRLALLLCILVMIAGCGKDINSSNKNIDNKLAANDTEASVVSKDSVLEDEDGTADEDSHKQDADVSKNAKESGTDKKSKAKDDNASDTEAKEKDSISKSDNDSAKSNDKKSDKDKNKKNADNIKKQKDKSAKDEKQYVSFTIECNEILDNLDKLSAAKRGLVPDNGIICQNTKVEIKEGDTVWDVLTKEVKANNIQMEYNYVPLYKTNYVEGIAGLYEFDMGDTSGWRYMVNGTYPGCGCDKYKLKDKDKIVWHYTVSLT